MTVTISDVLRESMQSRFGGSVTRLAEACDVSVQLASKWVAESERKRITPGPKSCQKIAAALGLDPDYVLELAGHRPHDSESTPQNPRLSAFIAAVEAAFHSMSAQEWEVREEAGRALFAVQPANGRRDRETLPAPGGRRANDPRLRSADDRDAQGGLSTVSGHLRAALASSTSAIVRLIHPAEPWPAAQPFPLR